MAGDTNATSSGGCCQRDLPPVHTRVPQRHPPKPISTMDKQNPNATGVGVDPSMSHLTTANAGATSGLPGASGDGAGGSMSAWSKRDKGQLLKLLMAFGLPRLPPAHAEAPMGPPDWARLRALGGFVRKDPEHVTAEYEIITHEADALAATLVTQKSNLNTHQAGCPCVGCKQKRKKGEDSGWGPADEVSPSTKVIAPAPQARKPAKAGLSTEEHPIDEAEPGVGVSASASGPYAGILTPITAVRLKERLELLDLFQRAAHVFAGNWAQQSISGSSVDGMPAWWNPGVHDGELVNGILEYGYGAWSAIQEDPRCTFLKASLALRPLVEESGGELAGEMAMPTPKAYVKRVKSLGNILRRALKRLDKASAASGKRDGPKPKQERVPLLEDGGETASDSDGNTPDAKRQARFQLKQKAFARTGDAEGAKALVGPAAEQVAAVVEKAKAAGGAVAILPLEVDPTLTLVELGTIEPTRGGFHNSTNVFPIGFTTVRRYESFVHKEGSSAYRCSVVDDGKKGPKFVIVADDAPEQPVEEGTPQAAWSTITIRCNKLRGRKRKDVTVDGVEMCGFNHAVITALLQTLPKYFECRRLKLPLHIKALGVKKNTADGRNAGVKRTEAMRASEADAAGVGAEGAEAAAATVSPEQVAKRARTADTINTVGNLPSLAAMAALDSNSTGTEAAVVPLPTSAVVDSPATTASPLHQETTSVGALMALATAGPQTVAQLQDPKRDVSGIPEAQTQELPQPDQ